MSSQWRESIEVPIDSLQEETLLRLIEEFVSREGTDYGEAIYSLEQKVAQVKRQLERGQALIVFDPLEECCSIVTKVAWERARTTKEKSSN